MCLDSYDRADFFRRGQPLPQLPRLVANQSLSYLVGFFGMYTLMVVAPIIGMIQLASLRKQVRAFYARFALSPEHQMAKQSESVRSSA
jgi:cytochrome b561